MSRNRILKPNRQEEQYINIGLKKPPYKATLPACTLRENEEWKIKLMSQLEHYKRVAPFYKQTTELINNLLGQEHKSLINFNVSSVEEITKFLGIKTRFELFSEIECQVEVATEPGIWGLNICKVKKASTYINSSGGEIFFPKEKFAQTNVKLGFIHNHLEKYDQRNDKFIPGLSILDVLMFNSREKTRELVESYSIKWCK